MADAPATVERKGREGGKWINERPTSVEFAEWFTENMKLDEKLKHENYVGGVVLIPTVSKSKRVSGFTANGAPVIEEFEELSYTPYAKVETRIAYFWDLLAEHEERLVGVVTRLTPPRLGVEEVLIKTVAEEGHETAEYGRPSALATMVHQLPGGFSVMSVPVGDRYSHFLICTQSVAIYRRDDRERLGDQAIPLREGTGSKQVPLLIGRNNPYADPNSLMKAETGALGRALGFAGVFVIPGSGVATAEDVMEAEGQGATPAEAEPTSGRGPAAPTETPARTGAEQAVDEEEELKNRALALWGELKESSPKNADEFVKWAHSRKLKQLSDAHGAMLRGVVKKLERLSEPSEETNADPGEETETGHSDERPEEAAGAESSGSAD